MKKIISAIFILMLLGGTAACDKEASATAEKGLKILVTGNSFIISSKVIQTAEMLFAEKNKPVEVSHFAGGSVDFFLKNIQSIPRLKEGYYDFVFLGCLYSPADYAALDGFIKELKGTKTRIVLFPADNEPDNLIEGAKIVYKKDMDFADWNMVLGNLSKAGFKKLNNGDALMHSNEVAGYAGACVIYSYLYGKMPKSVSTADHIIDDFADQVPGSNHAEKTQSMAEVEKAAIDAVLPAK